MTPFDRAIAFVLEWEGEWSDDPSGGVTRFGISSRAHPDIDLAAMTREKAVLFYRVAYWTAARCDRLPWPLSLVLFDGAVNIGALTATRFLQQALRVEDDGVVGPETIHAASTAYVPDVLRDMLAERAVFYAKEPERYRRGYYRRLLALLAAALTPYPEVPRWSPFDPSSV